MYKKMMLIASATILMASCKKSAKHEPLCNGSSPTYASTIKDIITVNCINCHQEYNSYNGLKVIVENETFENRVMDQQTMPKQGPLSDSDLNTLKCWLDNGYPEN